MGDQLIRESPAKIYLTLFYLSLLLNIFFLCQHLFFLPPSRLDSTVSALRWTRRAAQEAEAVAAISCSGHGRAYVDGVLDNGWPTCECNTCYTGADCSVLLSNCSADVDRLVIGRLYKINFSFGFHQFYDWFFYLIICSLFLFFYLVLLKYIVGYWDW